jgi:hypothetical protein
VSSFVDLARTAIQACTPEALAIEIREPRFPALIRRFLYNQLYPNNIFSSSEVLLRDCPTISTRIKVFNSAVTTFCAPGDTSRGISRMRREFIRAAPKWQKGFPRYDVIFLNRDAKFLGVRGMDIVRIRQFFSFVHSDTTFPCALVQWYTLLGDGPDEDTGMWVVKPKENEVGESVVTIIHLDCVIRACHLIGVFGDDPIPKVRFDQSLDAFKAFYINRYADHHTFKNVF